VITLRWVYVLTGVYLGAVAVRGVRDHGNTRRYTTSLFWGLLALVFLAGERLPPIAAGGIVVALALIAGAGGLRLGRYEDTSAGEKRAEASRLGNRLFWPALLVPALCLIGTLGAKRFVVGGRPILEPANVTLVSLGIACAVALVAACRLTRQGLPTALEQSRRLLDTIGWAALLPLLLATLGSVFAAAGVGEAVADVVRGVIPVDNRFVVVVAYALGMALFTIIMGNAFAAFPVMTAGIGLPLLVQLHGAEPASLGAIGMLSGYCGTLMTPMAANYNLVPAALLELKDPYGVIRVQAPTGAVLLASNVVLMYAIVFR
jgi:uncharacterized membrane protein